MNVITTKKIKKKKKKKIINGYNNITRGHALETSACISI